jgi:hypothetical protein
MRKTLTIIHVGLRVTVGCLLVTGSFFALAPVL